jgi:hypothetical protein
VVPHTINDYFLHTHSLKLGQFIFLVRSVMPKIVTGSLGKAEMPTAILETSERSF